MCTCLLMVDAATSKDDCKTIPSALSPFRSRSRAQIKPVWSSQGAFTSTPDMLIENHWHACRQHVVTRYRDRFQEKSIAGGFPGSGDGEDRGRYVRVMKSLDVSEDTEVEKVRAVDVFPIKL